MAIDNLRCPKCGESRDGTYLGNIMVTRQVSVLHHTKPNTPLAEFTFCPRCGHIGNLWLIKGRDDKPSEAQRLNITEGEIRRCIKSMDCDFYSLAELKAGKVRGAEVTPGNYDANMFVEAPDPREEI